jgi:hypothetical protein|tara:strand:- start:83 stop:1117 length:1035 start_codon:yes stop_codon:yes gene_type:complete
MLSKCRALIVFYFLASANAMADIVPGSMTAENLPEVGTEQTVYLGDRLVHQRVGFYKQCFTLKQDLMFTYKGGERECLKSSQLFQKRYSRGISQIAKDGILCPTSNKHKNRQGYDGTNFFGYQRKDGTDKRPARPWTLRWTKTNKRWYSEPSGPKVVDLPKEEFDQIFTKHNTFNVHIVTVAAGAINCSISSDIDFPAVHASASGVTKIPQRISGGNTMYVSLSDLERGKMPLDDSEDLILVQSHSTLMFDESFHESRAYQINEKAIQQSIEYAGRSGNTLTFIYAEFRGGMARSGFNREFSIDLSNGNVGAFKGAVFEVMEATNTTITYKVIRHFPTNANNPI